eukprot:COSAG02_NODE_15390_length_1175_cov_1.271375_3_plen_49_part_01
MQNALTAKLIGSLLLLDRLEHLARVARDTQEDDHSHVSGVNSMKRTNQA